MERFIDFGTFRSNCVPTSMHTPNALSIEIILSNVQTSNMNGIVVIEMKSLEVTHIIEFDGCFVCEAAYNGNC